MAQQGNQALPQSRRPGELHLPAIAAAVSYRSSRVSRQKFSAFLIFFKNSLKSVFQESRKSFRELPPVQEKRPLKSERLLYEVEKSDLVCGLVSGSVL